MQFLRNFQPVVYVKLHPDALTMREVRSGRNVTEPPVAAVSRESKKRLLGVGSAASAVAATERVDIVNPFKHPRSILADFALAEAVIKGFLKKLFHGRLFVPSPVLVLHPQVDPAGGFTQIEIRALRELAIGAGAAKAILWQGRDLTDQELLNQQFGSGGKVLNA